MELINLLPEWLGSPLQGFFQQPWVVGVGAALAAVAALIGYVRSTGKAVDEIVVKPVQKRRQAQAEHQQRGQRREAYVRALRDQMEVIPRAFEVPFETMGRRLMSEVRVEVQLVGHVEGSDGPIAELGVRGAGVRDRLTAAELLDRITARQAQNQPTRAVILGDPGCGKTMLLKELALVALDRLTAEPDRGWVPAFARLANVRWDASLTSLLASLGTDEGDPTLENARAAGRLLLLLDGLDENPDRRIRTTLLPKLLQALGPNAVVCTSRQIGYRPARRLFPEELRVQPLAPDAQRRLLERWRCPADRLDSALVDLQARNMREVAENPLLLTLVALVLRQPDFVSIPRRRSALYAAALPHLVRRDYTEPGQTELTPAERRVARGALGQLFLRLHGTADETLTPKRVAALLDSPDLAEVRAQVEATPRFGDAAGLLTTLARRTALLDLVPGTADHYTPPHRTLREFYVAEVLAGDLKGSDPDDPTPPSLQLALDQARTNPATWAEVLALACGLLDDVRAERLVRQVMAQETAELTYRVVAEAEQVSEATLLEVLGMTREDDPEAWQKGWDDRQNLLDRLPELVPGPEVALGLLQQFAQVTTHGADLYFVWRHLVELGEGRFGDATEVPDAVRRQARDRAETLWRDHRPEAAEAVLEALEDRGWWVPIAEGTFVMGSPEGEVGRSNDERQHHVHVTTGFEMMAVPVTNELYEHFDTGHVVDRRPNTDENHPVVSVTWYEAAAFAQWLQAAHRARDPSSLRVVGLPHEVEWEYACRAGTTTRFASGDTEADLAKVGWTGANSGGNTHPVGKLEPNAWGLYDLHGNVWEWCSSPRDPYPSGSRTHDPLPPVDLTDSGAGRVVRGGSFDYGAQFARSADRVGWLPSYRVPDLGFRLVRAPAPQPDGD